MFSYAIVDNSVTLSLPLFGANIVRLKRHSRRKIWVRVLDSAVNIRRGLLLLLLPTMPTTTAQVVLHNSRRTHKQKHMHTNSHLAMQSMFEVEIFD